PASRWRSSRRAAGATKLRSANPTHTQFMLNTLWLIPLLPFAGFLLNGLFGKRLGKGFVTAVALLASLGAAVAGTIAVVQYHAAYPTGERHVDLVYNWISSGSIGADLAFQLDPLSVVMLMVVTWLGFLIHL